MPKIGIIVSNFNSFITHKLLKIILDDAQKKNINISDIYNVPGAIELPFSAKQLAKTKKYDAIIVLGCVIRGDTDHYHYVCMQVSQGIQDVIINENIPVIFGVLTTNNKQQALERIKDNNYLNSAIHMINFIKKIQ